VCSVSDRTLGLSKKGKKGRNPRKKCGVKKVRGVENQKEGGKKVRDVETQEHRSLSTKAGGQGEKLLTCWNIKGGGRG